MEDGLGQLIEQFLSSVWGDAVVWFGGLWVVLLFIRRVFKDADDELDPEKRQSIAEELVLKSFWSSGSWIPDFTSVFDRFFGKNHFGWRCIYRSALISTVSFFLLALFTGVFSFASRYEFVQINLAEIMAVVFFMAMFTNALLDYCSLLETRMLLKTPLPTSIKILVDMILTFLISLAWISFVYWAMVLFTDSYYENLRFTWEIFAGHIEVERYVDPFQIERRVIVTRIVVATSFTTSIWLWLHGLAQLTIRGLNGAELVMSFLNVKEKPLRAVGTTINIFVLVIGVVLFPVFAIAG